MRSLLKDLLLVLFFFFLFRLGSRGPLRTVLRRCDRWRLWCR